MLNTQPYYASTDTIEEVTCYSRLQTYADFYLLIYL